MITKKICYIADKSGRPVKSGCFSEPELRMAAKAGFRVFEKSVGQSAGTEITSELQTLFDGGRSDIFF